MVQAAIAKCGRPKATGIGMAEARIAAIVLRDEPAVIPIGAYNRVTERGKAEGNARKLHSEIRARVHVVHEVHPVHVRAGAWC